MMLQSRDFESEAYHRKCQESVKKVASDRKALTTIGYCCKKATKSAIYFIVHIKFAYYSPNKG